MLVYLEYWSSIEMYLSYALNKKKRIRLKYLLMIIQQML